MVLCGFAKKCITPPLGTPVVGYYEARFAKGVIDDLFVRAVAFDDGERKTVILETDVGLMPTEIADAVRDRLAEAGVDRNAIYITCSHTHTGPLLGTDDMGNKPPAAYVEWLITALGDAAVLALADVRPARFYAATGEAKDISFIRRYRMKDGSVRTNPGTRNPDIDHALGTPDETVRVLRIVREGAAEILLVNFGTHADTVSGDYICADFPGVLCDTLEAALPGTVAVFLQGPEGDVNHFKTGNPSPELYAAMHQRRNPDPEARMTITRHIGRVLAGAVLSVYTLAREVPADRVAFATRCVDIPTNKEPDRVEEAKRVLALYSSGRQDQIKGNVTLDVSVASRILKMEEEPDAHTYTLFAMRVGDAALAFMPGEPFSEIGIRIRAASPFADTLLTCLTNAGDTYFPTSAAMSEGGYEAGCCPVKAGGDNILVKGMIDLLNELKGL